MNDNQENDDVIDIRGRIQGSTQIEVSSYLIHAVAKAIVHIGLSNTVITICKSCAEIPELHVFAMLARVVTDVIDMTPDVYSVSRLIEKYTVLSDSTYDVDKWEKIVANYSPCELIKAFGVVLEENCQFSYFQGVGACLVRYCPHVK